MILRAAKCRFGPMTERYVKGEMQSVETETKINIDGNTQTVKRGVLAGLDRSHNKDYTVVGVSDPLLAVHGQYGATHTEIKKVLERLDLWNRSLHPISIPRTDEDGQPAWAPAFKTTPEQITKFSAFKRVLDDNADGLALSSETDIEVAIEDRQKTFSKYK